MKKFVSMIMMCTVAFSLTASAAGLKLLFNKDQFQVSQTKATKWNEYPALTFPLVYSGTVKFEGWSAYATPTLKDGDDKNCVTTEKVTVDLFMTICQPCIDCIPCKIAPLAEETPAAPAIIAEPMDIINNPLLPITAWNLYTVTNFKKGKDKYTFIEKINLIDAQAVFFTGASGTAPGVIQVMKGEKARMLIGGKKSNYTFNYYTTPFGLSDEDDEGKLTWIEDSYEWDTDRMEKSVSRGYIKSIAELKGAFDIADDLSDGAGYQVTGTVSMKRDSKLTGMVVKAIFGINNNAKNDWENCQEDAKYCEQYFLSGGWDLFDDYLNDKYEDGLENFYDDTETEFGAFFMADKDGDDYEPEKLLDAIYEHIYTGRTLGKKSLKTGESEDEEEGGDDDQP